MEKGQKIEIRLSGLEQATMPALYIYGYIFHSVGWALVMRDKGYRALADGQLDEARTYFTECVEVCRKKGYTSLELKALVGLKRCGETVNLLRVEWLFKEIEGVGYKRIRASLLRFLGRP